MPLRFLIDRATFMRATCAESIGQVRLPRLFYVIVAIAFVMEGQLAASECAARAPITTASIAVQICGSAPSGNEVQPRAATVTLVRSGRTVRTVETDKRGFARISPPPGRYTVLVSHVFGFAQDVIVAARGGGPARVLAVLPWGECAIACEVQANTALAKPPDCLFAPRRVTP